MLFSDIRWQHFITRPMGNFFSIATIGKHENEMMRDIFGWGFKNVAIFSDDTVIHVYVDADEYARGVQWLAERVTNDPKGILDFFAQSRVVEENARQYIQETQGSFSRLTKEQLAPAYKELIGTLYSYMTYCVAAPFFTLNVIEQEGLDANSIQAAAEDFRSRDLRPQLRDAFVPAFHKQISNRCDLPFEWLGRLLPEEILDYFESGDRESLKKLYEERKEQFSFLFLDYKLVASEHEKMLGLLNTDALDPVSRNGQVAYAGQVTGPAVVILERKDFDKFTDGSILVSINSNPSFMPVIRKASAIVTDEGGMSCHAAIVSRELQIPCVMGVRGATRWIADGDMIHVDAHNGIVKKV